MIGIYEATTVDKPRHYTDTKTGEVKCSTAARVGGQNVELPTDEFPEFTKLWIVADIRSYDRRSYVATGRDAGPFVAVRRHDENVQDLIRMVEDLYKPTVEQGGKESKAA